MHKLKVGMVTDSGTIDDKSFNQGTWEGIQKATKSLGIKAKYLKPTGTTEADYVKEIGNLNDAGYSLIVTPGFQVSNRPFSLHRISTPKRNLFLSTAAQITASFDATRQEKVGPKYRFHFLC